ncbi:hypothetical protein WA026_016602 [Henosepilachna vigintioctopunctata]|uniref:Reverse transcriptase domain-containing protein n=1 Tax=Henosepilachna vigintioctopunctata TaxID=420089 RepID=A0AAW1V7Z0_9CUCU
MSVVMTVIYLRKCTLRELSHIVYSIKNTGARGPDHITIKDIKTILYIIKEKLLELINECLAEGKFPSSLKISKIIPIFKKGNNDDTSNYRPISITSTISKILESHKSKIGRLLQHL